MREARVSAVRVARVECKNRKAACKNRKAEYEYEYEDGREPGPCRLPQGQLRPLGGLVQQEGMGSYTTGTLVAPFFK